MAELVQAQEQEQEQEGRPEEWGSLSHNAWMTEEALVDIAVLSSASALVHYLFGIYGLLAASLVYLGVDRSDQVYRRIVEEIVHVFHQVYWGLLHRSSSWEKRGGRPWACGHQSRSQHGHEAVEGGEERDGNEQDDGANRRSMDRSNDDSSLHATAGRHGSTAASLRSSSQRHSNLIIQDVSSRNTVDHWQVAINTREPIPFETDLFEGKMLLLVRTNPEDPHWKHLFVGRRRMFWIQVQGRFKRPPMGTVYLGGELPSRVTPGLFTRSIALVIMSIIKKLVGKVHFSFGDSRNEEVPHISFPLYQSVDQFVCTPEGEEPPRLGDEDFGETSAQRKQRRATPMGTESYAVGPTYSFHFHTMYVDLTTWKTKNLPGMNDMDLSTFFDSLPLRIGAYDIKEDRSDKHPQTEKHYLFSYEIRYDQRRLHRTDSEHSGESISSSTAGSSVSVEAAPDTTASLADFNGGAVSNHNTSAPRSQALDRVAAMHSENQRKLRNVDFSFLFWMEELDLATAVRRVHYVVQVDTRDSDEVKSTHVGILSAAVLRDMLRKVHGGYLPQALGKVRFHNRSRIASYSTITQEAHDITMYLRQLVRKKVKAEGTQSPKDSMMLSTMCRLLHGRTDLDPSSDSACTPSKLGVNLTKHDRMEMQVAFEGIVYRFHNDSFLRQEVLVVTATELQFYRSFSSKPEKAVPCDRVIGVQATQFPLADDLSQTFAYVFQINTFAEEIVLCVHSEQARNAWIGVLLQTCHPQTNFDRCMEGEMYICATPCDTMKPANRMVLNSRILFPRIETQKLDAAALAEKALRMALAIHTRVNELNVLDMMEFLDATSLLRRLDLDVVDQLPHEQKLCFFLNLYHTMLAHAMIAHGFPRGKSHWKHFLTHTCYAVGIQRMTISLAELEHVILRARMPVAELPHLRMNFLKGVHAQKVSSFGLAHPDFRVPFALALYQPASDRVMVFQPSVVHDQLNHAAKWLLSRQVEVSAANKSIRLPRICEWFRYDYGSDGSPLHCIRKILGFLPDETQHEAMQLLDDPTNLQISFGNFRYLPRTTLHEDVTMALLSEGEEPEDQDAEDDSSASDVESVPSKCSESLETETTEDGELHEYAEDTDA